MKSWVEADSSTPTRLRLLRYLTHRGPIKQEEEEEQGES